MSNSTLKNLLKDYEKKRMDAILDLDNRKSALYASNKRLEEIEMELNSFALNTAKAILSANVETNCVDNLKEKIHNLKKEKESIWKRCVCIIADACHKLRHSDRQ